jgi:hypothetical protein
MITTPSYFTTEAQRSQRKSEDIERDVYAIRFGPVLTGKTNKVRIRHLSIISLFLCDLCASVVSKQDQS